MAQAATAALEEHVRKRGVVTAALLFITGSMAWAQEAPVDEEVSTTTGEVDLAPVAGEPTEEPAAEEPAAVAPAEETEDLEADMEVAKEKIDAAGYEEIEAMPVSEGSATEMQTEVNDVPASVRLSEGDTSKAWGMLVVMNHSMGTGTFLADSTQRSTYAYVGQSWDLRPSYMFDFMGHNLKAMARLGFELELTEPNANPARRFNPADASLYLMDNNIFTEPVSGVRFTGGVRYFFPTSYQSINVSERWGALSLFGSANRSFGPLYLVYSFGFTKNFNATKGAQVFKPMGARIRRDNPNDDLPSPADSAGDYAVGFNSSFLFSNSLAATYNFTDELSLSYSVALRNSFKYTQNNVNVVDEHTSPNADNDTGRSDTLLSTLDVTYVLDGVIKPLVDLPFSLMASVGLSAEHPAQTASNDGIMWPFFYQAMAENRAANNYATFYVDLMGVY